MSSPIKSPQPVRPLYISSESPETSDSLSSDELEELSKGLTGLLLQTSLSPRNMLVTLVQGDATVELCRALAFKAHRLTITELIVFIWVFVQQSYLADEREVLSFCLRILANKMCEVRWCREQKFCELVTLLSAAPRGEQVLKFLSAEEEGEPDEVEPEFIYKMWTDLAKIFNTHGVFERLEVEDICLSYSASNWIETAAESPDICIYSLLLMCYMCTTDRPEVWDFQMLSANPLYLHFVLTAISYCESCENAATLFLEFNAVFAEEGWPLVRGISRESFVLLEGILRRSPLALRDAPDICLAILENQQNEPYCKLSLVLRELNNLQYFDVKFLHRLFDLIFPMISCGEPGVVDVVKQIIDAVFTKFWIFSYVDVGCETLENLYSVYRNGAYQFFNTSFRRVVEAADEKSWKLLREMALEQVILSVVMSLERFATVNRARVVPDYFIDSYVNTLLSIKEVSFRLIFSLYAEIVDSNCKLRVFNALKRRLPKIFVVDLSGEFGVEIMNDGTQEVLYFSANDTEMIIKEPL